MKLVLNLQNLIPLFSVADAAKLTAQAGFGATDYFLQEMKDPESVFNSDRWYEYASDCKKTFSDYAVPIVQTHAPLKRLSIRPLFDL